MSSREGWASGVPLADPLVAGPRGGSRIAGQTLGGHAGPSRRSARRAVTYGRMPVNDEQSAQSGSTGGAATHKGMWYQALWCVLQAARARLDASDSGLRLVLEPLRWFTHAQPRVVRGLC